MPVTGDTPQQLVMRSDSITLTLDKQRRQSNLAAQVSTLGSNTALPIVMTPGLTLVLFVLTVAMCVISAIAAIVQVTRIDPAMVFTR